MAEQTDKNGTPEGPEEKIPGRPLECSECKKSVMVRYTEIVGQTMTHTSMCQDCPELQRRLQGSHAQATHTMTLGDGSTGLACGNCGTTLEALRHGNPLGCSICYEVFDDILLSEMLSVDKIPTRIIPTKKAIPIHIGRAPGEMQQINSSLRLLSLNEALSETLKREDYEQAALLRDQIKALTDDTETVEDLDESKP